MVAFTDWTRTRAPAWRGRPLLAAAAVLAVTATSSHAQQGAWRPERTVEIVVPAAAGGSIDATARLMQKLLQQNRIVEVPVVAVNKTGGGGNIALNYLDQRAGDGHVLLNSTMSLMTNHILGLSKVTYTDYTPLAILYGEYMVFVVKPESPLRSARDVMETLKKDPHALNVAIGVALGGTNHLTVGLVTKSMSVDVKKLKTVVFQSNAQALVALMGGHVDIAPMSVAAAKAAAQQGQLRIIGITSERRVEGVLSEVPTFKEQGLDVVFSNTRFMIGPRAMAPAQTAYWDAALERMVQSEEWRNEVRKNDWALDYQGSRQSGQRMATLYDQLKGALVDAGLVKE